MDCVRYSVANLKRVIPMDVLRAVFLKRTPGYRDDMDSLDELMLATVIRPRVLVDCNLVGGTEAFIPLDNIPAFRENDYTSVYRIPKDRTQGRSITSVLNITFSDPTKVSAYGTAAGSQNAFMLQQAQSVMDAMGTIPMTSTARVQLIGENVVMVRDTVLLPANIYLRCILANDENLAHIQMKSYRAFAKMVELAVKSYIYIQYVIPLDMGALVGGQQLGRIKEIVDSYADAEQMYSDFVTEKWTKIAEMNDGESNQRLLRMILGGSR